MKDMPLCDLGFKATFKYGYLVHSVDCYEVL